MSSTTGALDLNQAQSFGPKNGRLPVHPGGGQFSLRIWKITSARQMVGRMLRVANSEWMDHSGLGMIALWTQGKRDAHCEPSFTHG